MSFSTLSTAFSYITDIYIYRHIVFLPPIIMIKDDINSDLKKIKK